MNILITGISGFVGTNLVAYLTKDNRYTIYGLDRCQQKKSENVKQVYSWGDLENDIFPRIDVVIHLAGKAHDTKDSTLRDEYFKVNTDLTKKIFDYSIRHSIKKFIFFSSVKAAADTVTGPGLTENIVPKPIGPYGESKIEAEKYIQTKVQTETPLIEYFILRPCMIHGPGNKGNLNLLYNIVKKGIPWPLGAYENKRSFCSIYNILFTIDQLLIRNNIDSGIYHICDDEPLSTNELIQEISESVNKTAHIWKVPKTAINIIAKIGDILHLPLNTQRLQKLSEDYVVSNQKIKSALKINKFPVTSVDGLKKTFQSFNK